jgi:hypothetical protein
LQEEAEWAVFKEYLKIKVHVDKTQKLFSNFVLSVSVKNGNRKDRIRKWPKPETTETGNSGLISRIKLSSEPARNHGACTEPCVLFIHPLFQSAINAIQSASTGIINRLSTVKLTQGAKCTTKKCRSKDR